MVWLKSILSTLFDNGVKVLNFVGYFCIFSLLAYSVLALILGTNKEKDTRFVAEEYFQVINDYRIDNNRVPILEAGICPDCGSVGWIVSISDHSLDDYQCMSCGSQFFVIDELSDVFSKKGMCDE